MESFPSFLITKKVPSPSTIRALLHGPFTWLSAMVYGLFIAACATFFILLVTINNHFLVTVPARGGTLTEGVIGAPAAINPLLATTSTDKRLVSLVYGSLMNVDADGKATPSLAKDYIVSPDGTTYTVELLPDLRFDDNKPLTSDDVVFTVQKMQNNSVSQNSDYWQHIAVENPDAVTIVFTLPTADTTFMSHLDFGILPRHVWQDVADEDFDTAPQNLHPVGAGVFRVADIEYADGIPTAVILKRNAHVLGDQSMLRKLTLVSFANQSQLVGALNAGNVDFSYSVTPDGIADRPVASDIRVQAVPTSQQVSLYRSSQDAALANPAVIAQLSQIIDKSAIIATVQHGYGTPIGVTANSVANTGTGNGTKKITLNRFSLAVENDPSLLLAAQALAAQLQHYGVTVSVRAFDPGAFQQSISAGTFSLFLARSNEMSIPANYSIALPLYAESLPYAFTAGTHTIIANTLESPTAEYDSVRDWYTNTDKLWKWLAPQKK